MLTLKPFVSRSLRRLGADTSYRSAAAKSWEVEPRCETVRVDTIFEERDLSKVTAVAPHTSLEYQLGRIARGSSFHKPRYAHLLKNVVMVDGHLFQWKMVQPLAHRPLPGVARRDAVEIDAGVMASTENGNRFFGHWLLDDMPLALSAAEFGTPYGHVGADNRLSSHQQEYESIFDPRVRLIQNAHFRELIIFDPAEDSVHQQKRYRALSGRMVTDRDAGPHPGVMLLRGNTGQKRLLVNEKQIAELASERGISILDPMSCSVRQIVDATKNARVVMGVEGSHLCHGFLPLAAGGAIYTLQPPFKFDNFWKERCDCVGATYAFTIGERVNQTDFEVDPDQVSRMLDRLETATRRNGPADALVDRCVSG